MKPTAARRFAASNESGKEPATEAGPEWHWSFDPGHRAWTQRKMNALFIGESQRAWWRIARRLEQRGCNCWFASTNEELRALLSQRSFYLVLSAHPVTEGGPLMDLLQAPERFVFYSFPIEDSCLWFQAIPEISNVSPVSALRPSEFMSILDALLTSEGDSPRRFQVEST
jgi:hypothetical protein